MAELDFMGTLHKSTKRDYLARVNDPEYPKAKAAKLAKKFAYDYWDGDRRICYGGYKYIEGRWEKIAEQIAKHYSLPPKAKILDIGCGKGYLLYDFLKILPEAEIFGICSFFRNQFSVTEPPSRDGGLAQKMDREKSCRYQIISSWSSSSSKSDHFCLR